MDQQKDVTNLRNFEMDRIIFNIGKPNICPMNSRYFRSLSLLVVFLLIISSLSGQELPAAKPEDVGLSSERLQRLTSVFQAYVTDKKMAGSVVLVARHGKVVYFNSFGKRDIESGTDMKNDAIFRIASQTKAIVSVGIMILQEEG